MNNHNRNRLNLINVKLLFVFSVFVILNYSCKKDPVIIKPDPVITPTPEPKPVASNKAFKLDSIRKQIKLRTDIRLVSDSVWKDSTGVTFKVQNVDKEYSFAFSPLFKDSLYVGALASEASLLNGSGQSMPEYRAGKLSYYFSNPWNLEEFQGTFEPSLLATKKFISDVFRNARPRKQVEYSQGARTGFSDYNVVKQQYLKLSAGANINDYLDFSNQSAEPRGRLKKKNGFLLYAATINHDLVIERSFPYKEIYLNTNGTAITSKDAAVIESLSYGSIALLTIESDHTFGEINAAFTAMTDGQASAEQRAILEQAVSGVFIKGFSPSLEQAMKAARGYEKIKAFYHAIDKGYIEKGLGAPLFYQATNLTTDERIGYHLQTEISFTF